MVGGVFWKSFSPAARRRSVSAARSKFVSRFESSHCCNANGTVTVRLTSWRSRQNPPVTRTAVNGTGCTG